VEELLPKLTARLCAMIESLERTLSVTDPVKARTEIAGIVGQLQVIATPTEWRIESQGNVVQRALCAVNGHQESMVAGA
jgi:hypothetical protein